jgi:hypothetical protein
MSSSRFLECSILPAHSCCGKLACETKGRGHLARDCGQPQEDTPTKTYQKCSMGGEQGRLALETKNKATRKNER